MNDGAGRCAGVMTSASMVWAAVLTSASMVRAAVMTSAHLAEEARGDVQGVRQRALRRGKVTSVSLPYSPPWNPPHNKIMRQKKGGGAGISNAAVVQ